MLWFLTIHIIAMLFWCAALLYLPALIITSHNHAALLFPPKTRGSMARFLFTNISSPIALIAIASGTLVFLIEETHDIWLLAKLVLVTGLTIIHALIGLLLLRVEAHPDKPVRLICWTLEIIFILLMIAILWIVLAKPDLEALL